MKVYEVSQGIRYEGSSVVAIYATADRAMVGAWEEAERLNKIYKSTSENPSKETEWTVSTEKKCLFYIANDLDDYIFVKEREVIE
jgi:hypothetical protein